MFARRPWTTGWNNFIIHQRFLKVMLNIIYLYIRWICPPVFFLNVKHRHKFIIGEIISDSSMLQVSLIDIFDRFFSDSSNAADIFEPFEDHSLSAPTSRPLRSNIAVIQLTFHVCISHRTLFHILTLNPVGIPTVYKFQSQSLQGFFNVHLLWIECMSAVLTGTRSACLDRSKKCDRKLMD